MILPCPSRDNGNRNREFPERGAPASDLREKRRAIVDLATYQDGELANLAKTMPLACCPPAFVLSHRGGLFSPQTSEKQLFLRKQVGASKWIPC